MRLSWEAIVALGRLGAGRALHGVPVAGDGELAAAGITLGRLVTAGWQPMARTLAHPVGRARLVQRTCRGVRRTVGWIGPEATVLATADPDGRYVVAAVPGADVLPLLVARLTGLGPRPRPPVDAEPLEVARGAIGRVLEAGAAEAGPGARLASRWREQWRVAVAWRTADGTAARDGCDVVDADAGLWLVEPAGFDRLALGPVGADVVWRRLLGLVPSVEARPPAGWRTCRLPELGAVVDLPSTWRLRPSRVGFVAAPAAGAGPPGSMVLRVHAPAVDPDAALRHARRSRAAPQLIDVADDALGGRPARRHLYHHGLGDEATASVAWANAGKPAWTLEGAAPPGRFLEALETFARIAASLGPTAAVRDWDQA